VEHGKKTVQIQQGKGFVRESRLRAEPRSGPGECLRPRTVVAVILQRGVLWQEAEKERGTRGAPR